MVSTGQIVHDHDQLVGYRLNFIALGSDQFEHIWIFLVRHNAASRGEFIGEGDKIKIDTEKGAYLERVR